jgi:hypothetical protein
MNTYRSSNLNSTLEVILVNDTQLSIQDVPSVILDEGLLIAITNTGILNMISINQIKSLTLT